MTKIMIVDDNSNARKALKAYLSQQRGLEVTAEASNGQEAIQNIKSQIPDVILMDMRMPVMDGTRATQIVKSEWPDIKVIILTIYADLQAEAASAGADDFLVKGCPMEDLTGSIHKLFHFS